MVCRNIIVHRQKNHSTLCRPVSAFIFSSFYLWSRLDHYVAIDPTHTSRIIVRVAFYRPDLSNRTVRQSNPIEHQSFDCRAQSNIIELTIKFCQSNIIERSITELPVLLLLKWCDFSPLRSISFYQSQYLNSHRNCLFFVLFEHWHTCSMMFSSWLFNKSWQWLYSTCFTQFEASRDNCIGLVRFCSIILVRLVRKSNSQQNRCSILFDCRTQSNDWSSIGFLFGFVRLDRSGV